MNTKEIGFQLKNCLGLRYFPVGLLFSEHMPENAKSFKKKGNGCIVPLIFSSAKGQTVAIDKNSTGWACSAFYLGYQKWIFEGIECFLSDGTVAGRTGERFIKTPELAKAFVSSFIPEEINQKVTVFKPLENFNEDEIPTLVNFFVNADELSGLIFLLHHHTPTSDDLVVTGLNSGCASLFTKPMKLLSEGKHKAVWGMQDISARLRLPKDIMTLSVPYQMVVEMAREMDQSFIQTENWNKIKARNENA